MSARMNKRNQRTSPRRYRNRQNRGRNRSTFQNNIPMGRGTRFRNPRYRMMRSTRNAQTIIMQGVDLVQPIMPYVSAESASASHIFLSIPANPLYWKGTRIAAQASAYQQYRPLKFSVKYVPSVPVTTAGQIVYGTLWNVGVPTDNLQQSLVTSNGGGISTIYQYAWSHVKCTRQTLPLRFYNTGDNMAENTTCPFVWTAFFTGSNNAQGAPGYVILHWKYEFTVGIGQTAYTAYTYNQSNQTNLTIEAHSSLNAENVEWGIAIGALLKSGLEVLRNTSVFLLRSTLAHTHNPASSAYDSKQDSTILIGSGNLLNYDLNANHQVDAPDENGFTCVGMNGNFYFIPNKTPVVAYMCGERLMPVVNFPQAPDQTPGQE